MDRLSALHTDCHVGAVTVVLNELTNMLTFILCTLSKKGEFLSISS